MWEKPSELTNYTDVGYEIAYFTTYPHELRNLAQASLKAWKKSKGHNDIIINRSKWTSSQWKAIGIGIFNGYVCV